MGEGSSKQLECLTDYSLHETIETRLENSVVGFVGLEVSISDGLGSGPVDLGYMDVSWSEADYDGDSQCGLSEGAFVFLDDDVVTAVKDRGAINNDIIRLLLDNTARTGAIELIKQDMPQIDEFARHYRQLLDEYRDQQFTIPLLNLTTVFSQLVYGSLGLMLALLIWTTALFRRIYESPILSIEAPWGFYALSELAERRILVWLEGAWFTLFYLSFPIAPLVLISVFFSDTDLQYEPLMFVIAGIVAIYSVLVAGWIFVVARKLIFMNYYLYPRG